MRKLKNVLGHPCPHGADPLQSIARKCAAVTLANANKHSLSNDTALARLHRSAELARGKAPVCLACHSEAENKAGTPLPHGDYRMRRQGGRWTCPLCGYRVSDG